MKSIKKYMLTLALASLTAMTFVSCSEDKFTESIFDDGEETYDLTTTKGRFEKWLKINFLEPYNVDFRYKMQDLSAFIDYNMSPPTMQQSMDCAVLCKYLWYDVYSEIAGDEFLKTYSPRILQLIGSSAYDPDNHTEILGLAESGIKINLLKLNYADVYDFDHMNEYVFKTMHHEFAHILHQAITYPTEFNTLSVGGYDASNWQYRIDGVVNSLGFTTPYASSQFREDVAETIANYITMTDTKWARVKELAARGWESPNLDDDDPEAAQTALYYCWYYLKNPELGEEAEGNKVYVGDGGRTGGTDYGDAEKARLEANNKRCKNCQTINSITRKKCSSCGEDISAEGSYLAFEVLPVPDKDGKDGAEILDKKVDILRNWLKENFGVDIDAIRAEVQKRQGAFSTRESTDELMARLRKQIDDVK